jgi:hypothetical protein
MNGEFAMTMMTMQALPCINGMCPKQEECRVSVEGWVNYCPTMKELGYSDNENKEAIE